MNKKLQEIIQFPETNLYEEKEYKYDDSGINFTAPVTGKYEYHFMSQNCSIKLEKGSLLSLTEFKINEKPT